MKDRIGKTGFRPEGAHPTIISVSGIRGGSGKTSFVANASAALAKSGQKVLVVDLVPGLSQVCRMLGVPLTGVSLRDYYNNKLKLEDVAVATRIPNLSVIRHGVVPDMLKSRRTKANRLIQRLRKLNFDTILLDLGDISGSIGKNCFILSDYRAVLLTAPEHGTEGLSQLVLSASIASFEYATRGMDGSRRAVKELLDKYGDNPEISLAEIGILIGFRWPKLVGSWEKVTDNFGLALVLNFVTSHDQLDSLKNETSSIFERISYGNGKILSLPKYEMFSANVSVSDEEIGFLSGASAVIRDILGVEALTSLAEKDLLTGAQDNDYAETVVEAERFWKKDFGNLDMEFEEEKRRRMAQLKREIESARETELGRMTYQLDKFTSEHRKIAFTEIETDMVARRDEMNAKLENMKKEKMAEINRRLESHEMEVSARVSVEMEKKTAEMEKEMASAKIAKRRERDEGLEVYYRNAKVSFDHQMAQRKKRKERDIDDEIQLKRKKAEAKMQKDMTAEVDKVREMIWQQLEEKRVARISQIDEMVEQYRQGKKEEAENEKTSKSNFMEKELQKEMALIRENLMMDVFRDVMDVSSIFDTEDLERKNRSSERLEQEIRIDREKRKKELNSEMAEFREAKERQALEFIEKHKKGQMKAFNHEMDELRVRMKSKAILETEEKKKKLLEKTIELVQRKRGELSIALGREKDRKYYKLEREILETRTKRRTELKREMELLASGLEREIRQKMLAEEKQITDLLDDAFEKRKKEKEEFLLTFIKSEREKRLKYINDEVMQLRESMADNVKSEMRIYKVDQEDRLRGELSHMREQKLKKVDHEIQREIHRKTQSISLSLKDVEVAMRQEMHEKNVQEELRLRKVMTADLNIEMSDLRRRVKRELADEEVRTKSQLRTFLGEEKKRRLDAYEHEIKLRKSKNEEYLSHWQEKRKAKLMRDLLSKLGEEEKTQREQIAVKMESERNKISEALLNVRKRMERGEKLKLNEWVRGKRTEAINKVKKIIREEHKRRLGNLQKRIAAEKSRMMAELDHEIGLSKQHRLTELNTEIFKNREDMVIALDSEMRELRRKKEFELEEYANDETRRMEDRLDKRHRQIARKKEEWLEFEIRRRMIELTEAGEKEVNTEKDKRLQQHLVNMELEMVERKRKNMLEVDGAKVKILQNLRSELNLRRKKTIRKMTARLNELMQRRRKQMINEIEEVKMKRRLNLEKEITEAKESRIKAFEKELEVERSSRIEQLSTRIKTEEYVKRQEMISHMVKKKTELDRFYEQEKKKYYDRLQNEILNHKQISAEYLQDELARLQKTWNLN